MPDTSSDACDRRSTDASHSQPLSTDKPLMSPPHSSLQVLEAQSLSLPLPRRLQPLLWQHVDGSPLTDASLDNDGAELSISLTLHVDTSAPTDGADSQQHAQLSSSLLDWTAIVAQLHFITQHYPATNLPALANVIATYLCLSNQLTTLVPATPSPVRHLTILLSLLPPPVITAQTAPPAHSHTVTVAQSDVPPPKQESNGWGEVDVLIETSAPSAGLYLLHVAPHCSIPSHVHRVMCEAEMVMTDGLKCQDTAARWGAVHAWGEAVHGYTNDSERPATVLCMDTPAFIPADEIVVTGQPMAAVEVQQAGQPVWQQLARSLLLDPHSGRPMASFLFPGCYSRQSCRLSFGVSAVRPADAVLLFVLSPCSGSSSPSVLFVRHRVRGFELPGGKVEHDESERQAAVRELREEAGLALSEQTLRPIAQYTLDEEGGAAAHTKAVYAAMVDEPLTGSAGHRWLETDKAEWRELPSWSTVRDDSGYSVLLRDNVYAICSRVVEELWRQARERI